MMHPHKHTYLARTAYNSTSNHPNMQTTNVIILVIVCNVIIHHVTLQEFIQSTTHMHALHIASHEKRCVCRTASRATPPWDQTHQACDICRGCFDGRRRWSGQGLAVARTGRFPPDSPRTDLASPSVPRGCSPSSLRSGHFGFCPWDKSYSQTVYNSRQVGSRRGFTANFSTKMFPSENIQGLGG